MLRLHYGELNAHDTELEGFTGGNSEMVLSGGVPMIAMIILWH